MCFRRTRALALWLAFRGLCLAGIGVLGLTGCSSIKGFLVPVPSDYDAPGTTHVEMVVATTRTRAASPAVMFSGGRAPEPSYADMIVSIPPDANRKIGQVQWPQQLPGDPAVDFVALKADVISKDQAIAAFSRLLRQSHKKEALVFVHGFNQRYEDAVYRFAQILHDSGADADVAPVLFTWPSKGNVYSYLYDRDSSNYSRDALESLLRYLAKDPQVEKISILAHSMGNWVTRKVNRKYPKPMGPEEIVYGDKVINLDNTDPSLPWYRHRKVYPAKDSPYIANGEIGMAVGFFRKKGLPDLRYKLEVEFSSQPRFQVRLHRPRLL